MFKRRVCSIAMVFCFFISDIKVFATLNETNTTKKNLYEKRKVSSTYNYDVYSKANEEYISPKMLEKMKAMRDYEILVPKTDENYEVALAYEDGSYSFIEGYNDYDKALIKVKEEEKKYSNNEIIPTIIDKNGQVVYASNSMGRVWKHIDGEGYQGDLLTSSVYPSASSESEFIVINQNSIDDVPIIEDNGKRAKIQVNGYKGWINRDTSSDEYDLQIIPINQVKNPSYYYVNGGCFYHYISYNMTDSDDTNGHSIRIGKAPEFMKEGKEYYSYDGVYFYSGVNRLEGLNKLVSDLRNDTTINSVNNNNPYYNYYQYLPFRTKTNYTAEQLNKFIESNTDEDSKLRGLGEVLIQCQDKYGVNPLLALGIAIHESRWGVSINAKDKNNLFGLNAVDISPGQSADTYNSPEECVTEFAYYWISRGYADPQDWRYNGGLLGNKAIGANVKYASDPYWGEKAAQYAFTIDLYLSDGKIENLNDYNGYQLLGFNKDSKVVNKDNNVLYNITKEIICEDDFYIFNVLALKFDERNSNGLYEVFGDRTDSVSLGEYEGGYEWNISCFVNRESSIYINDGNDNEIPGFSLKDVNRDGSVNISDLASIAFQYNMQSGDDGFKRRLDLNSDNFIDIFDLVLIGKEM